MRSRFALFVAAAVIFAPGWHGQDRPQPLRGSDLAASVLAPTVDEGAISEAAANATHQLGGRHTKRWRPDITFETVATIGVGGLPLAIFWLVALYAAPQIGLYRLRFRFSRAPPRFQPA
ncbi:MAG TPA: hypothetical protein VFF07_13290 [Actinomycetota bacterium]|nr:hypothetical protein [Actinomycetota bacterium]